MHFFIHVKNVMGPRLYYLNIALVNAFVQENRKETLIPILPIVRYFTS